MQLKKKWVAASVAAAAIVAVLLLRGGETPGPAPVSGTRPEPRLAEAPAAPADSAAPAIVADRPAPSPPPPALPPPARPARRAVAVAGPATSAAPVASTAAEPAARAALIVAEPASSRSAPATTASEIPPSAELARATAPAEPPPDATPSRFSFGVQVAALAPVAGDLPTTTGFPVSGSIGLHADWRLGTRQTIRPRVDAALFWEGQQTGTVPPLTQELSTRVSSVGIGADYLFRLGGEEGRFAVGAHVAAIRWAVSTSSTVAVAGAGASSASDTSSWWRPGAGLVCEYRLGRQLAAEGRLIFSSYGHERLAANTASLGLLWGF